MNKLYIVFFDNSTCRIVLAESETQAIELSQKHYDGYRTRISKVECFCNNINKSQLIAKISDIYVLEKE